MSDDTTRTRFLGAIAAQIPAERVVEVHLFGAIRQGGAESGVAVIALDPNEPVPADDVTASPDVDAVAEESAPAADETFDAPDVVDSVDAVLEEPVVRADGAVVVEGEAFASPYAGESIGDVASEADETSDVATARRPAPRYTVYTARYRHTLKGPDRGKWEASVTEEADAPLLTVDAVVRGVSRRSGEADETVRLSGDEFRAALPAPAQAPAARPGPAASRA